MDRPVAWGLQIEPAEVGMETAITKGSIIYLDDCEDALVDSELGKRYFSQTGSARRALEEGFGKEEIYVALDESQRCAGFIWFIMNGAFHAFPYLHIVAVKAEHRSRGIGKKLLDFFEETCFASHARVFLVVADFNPDAKRLYERLGYVQVGSIPGLYRPGITEYLMMKSKE
jgi:ribosomal protein S18 acetylase RimI-like enzyme